MKLYIFLHLTSNGQKQIKTAILVSHFFPLLCQKFICRSSGQRTFSILLILNCECNLWRRHDVTSQTLLSRHQQFFPWPSNFGMTIGLLHIYFENNQFTICIKMNYQLKDWLFIGHLIGQIHVSKLINVNTGKEVQIIIFFVGVGGHFEFLSFMYAYQKKILINS